MNFLMFLKKLRIFFLRIIFRRRPKISLLIPFSSKDPIRKRNFKWLLEYWYNELPDAEIIIGHSKSKIFCKGEALNDAVSKSTGRVLVILDADAYLPGQVIERCANRILEEQAHGNRLWYVPYRRLYRLRKWITDDIIYSDPTNPLRIPHPTENEIENSGDMVKYGHRYGAMIMMFPREAYDLLGSFDERFRGWGGEDIALLRALDTLYAKHKTTKNNILHLWHPFFGQDYKSRMWDGQRSGGANSKLAQEYHKATRNPSKMRDLVNDGYRHFKSKK